MELFFLHKKNKGLFSDTGLILYTVTQKNKNIKKYTVDLVDIDRFFFGRMECYENEM